MREGAALRVAAADEFSFAVIFEFAIGNSRPRLADDYCPSFHAVAVIELKVLSNRGAIPPGKQIEVIVFESVFRMPRIHNPNQPVAGVPLVIDLSPGGGGEIYPI